MKQRDVVVGKTYVVKVSDKLARVKLVAASPRGGYVGRNLDTGREIRIRTAARLRSEVTR